VPRPSSQQHRPGVRSSERTSCQILGDPSVGRVLRHGCGSRCPVLDIDTLTLQVSHGVHVQCESGFVGWAALQRRRPRERFKFALRKRTGRFSSGSSCSSQPSGKFTDCTKLTRARLDLSLRRGRQRGDHLSDAVRGTVPRTILAASFHTCPSGGGCCCAPDSFRQRRQHDEHAPRRAACCDDSADSPWRAIFAASMDPRALPKGSPARKAPGIDLCL